MFIGRNDAKAESPVLWPPDAKSSLIGKDTDAGRNWGQEEEGTTEDQIAGGIPDLMDVSLSELWELVMACGRGSSLMFNAKAKSVLWEAGSSFEARPCSGQHRARTFPVSDDGQLGLFSA